MPGAAAPGKYPVNKVIKLINVVRPTQLCSAVRTPPRQIDVSSQSREQRQLVIYTKRILPCRRKRPLPTASQSPARDWPGKLSRDAVSRLARSSCSCVTLFSRPAGRPWRSHLGTKCSPRAAQYTTARRHRRRRRCDCRSTHVACTDICSPDRSRQVLEFDVA